MDNWQVLWGINTFLLAVVAFFYKLMREDMKDLKIEILKRTLIITCDKIHNELAKDIHIHGSFGQAGEVIRK